MRKITLFLLVQLLIVSLVFAQQRTVTGKVTDDKGAAIAGASVMEKGTKNGASTNDDGTFSLRVKNGATLIISALSFENKQVKATDVVSVQLAKTTENLTDVVVTALGVKREKRSLGYGTQTIGTEEINKSGTGNPLNELSGKASGLTVINSAGDPGSGTFVLLRGVTSITGNNQPLMVIDGVPIDNSSNNFDPQFNGFQAGGANADLLGSAQPSNRGIDLNPNDIESITLLKGPAATALYGIQAASGAMVITTKKGGASGGKRASVSVNSSVTFDRASQLPGVQTQFAQGNNGVYSGPSSGTPYSWGPNIDTLYWDGSTTNKWDKHGNIVGKSNSAAKTPVTPYNTFDFFKTGVTLENNVSVSGGNPDGGFRMSLGNLNQTGIIPKSGYNKTTFSVSGQSKLSNNLNVSGSVSYINSTNQKVQQGSNLSGIMLGLLRTTPTFDNSNGYSNAADHPEAYLFPDGRQRSYRGYGTYDNPYYTVNKNPFTSNLNRVFGFGQVNYQIADWISLGYRLGADLYSQDDKNGFGSQSGAYKSQGGAIFLINYFNHEYNSDFTINLKKSYKDFTMSLLLGHNYFELNNNTKLMKGVGLNIPDFFDISNAQTLTNTESEGRKRTMAFYGDAEFSYKRMLYLSITGRREESSTLPAANNVFFYPSANLGWVFTELESLKNNKVLSFGKLRISAAQVGKDAPIYALQTPFSSPFSFTDGYVVNGVTLNTFGISTNITTIGNPNLKPEKTVSYEGGVDLGFFMDRITLNATYYSTKSSDVIIPASVSYSTGFAGETLNAATLSNKGIEITLNTTPIKSTRANGVRWDLNFNWSHNSNKVVSLVKGLDRLLLAGFGAGEFEIDAVAGQPYGVIYGNTTPHSVLNDLKSPLLINDDPADATNKVGQPLGGGVGPNMVIGNPNPKWLGSITSNLKYMGFTLGIQLNIKCGGDIINGTRGAIAYRGLAKETANRGTNTVFKGLLGHLNANGDVVHFVNGVETAGPGTANTTQTTYDEHYWQNVGSSTGGGQEVDIENGGYTKLRQVSLTYELPSSFTNKIKFTGLSLTIFANNLHTWTKYDGVDPETSLAGPANAQGMDYFNNPGTRSYGIRLNVGL